MYPNIIQAFGFVSENPLSRALLTAILPAEHAVVNFQDPLQDLSRHALHNSHIFGH